MLFLIKHIYIALQGFNKDAPWPVLPLAFPDQPRNTPSVKPHRHRPRRIFRAAATANPTAKYRVSLALLIAPVSWSWSETFCGVTWPLHFISFLALTLYLYRTICLFLASWPLRLSLTKLLNLGKGGNKATQHKGNATGSYVVSDKLSAEPSLESTSPLLSLLLSYSNPLLLTNLLFFSFFFPLIVSSKPSHFRQGWRSLTSPGLRRQ